MFPSHDRAELAKVLLAAFPDTGKTAKEIEESLQVSYAITVPAEQEEVKPVPAKKAPTLKKFLETFRSKKGKAECSKPNVQTLPKKAKPIEPLRELLEKNPAKILPEEQAIKDIVKGMSVNGTD